MTEYKPLHKSDLILKDMGDEFLIYSAEHKELHVINPTPRLIRDMCDGKHSIRQLEDEIRSHFSIRPEADITVDILKTIIIFWFYHLSHIPGFRRGKEVFFLKHFEINNLQLETTYSHFTGECMYEYKLQGQSQTILYRRSSQQDSWGKYERSGRAQRFIENT